MHEFPGVHPVRFESGKAIPKPGPGVRLLCGLGPKSMIPFSQYSMLIRSFMQVKLMQLVPQLSTLSSALTSEILRNDASLHSNRDPRTLLSVGKIRFFRQHL